MRPAEARDDGGVADLTRPRQVRPDGLSRSVAYGCASFWVRTRARVFPSPTNANANASTTARAALAPCSATAARRIPPTSADQSRQSRPTIRDTYYPVKSHRHHPPLPLGLRPPTPQPSQLLASLHQLLHMLQLFQQPSCTERQPLRPLLPISNRAFQHAKVLTFTPISLRGYSCRLAAASQLAGTIRLGVLLTMPHYIYATGCRHRRDWPNGYSASL